MKIHVRQLIRVRKKVAAFTADLFAEVSSSMFNEDEFSADLIGGWLGDILHAVGIEDPEQQTDAFLAELPVVRRKLEQDANFMFEGDPAGHSVEEVISSYPGFYAIAVYRLASVLLKQGIPLVPRMMSASAQGTTGVDIHPGASIDSPVSIDHGTGVVIGETARVAHHVKLFQGVTLGALTVEKGLENSKRHPTIEDHVVIYSNSTILGGETRIGAHSVIGGNVFLTKSVAPYSVVYHRAEISIRSKNKPENEPINFVI